MTKTRNNKLLYLVSLFIICCFSSCTLPANNQKPIWHQHYQPIEDEEILTYAWNSFSLATIQYGPPRIQVQNLHIRQSIAKKQNALLARADVYDWTGLTTAICSEKHALPELADVDRLQKTSCAAASQHDRNLPLSSQLVMIRQLNNLIESDSFGADYMVNPKAKNISNDPAGSRRFLENLFPQAILKMPVKQPVQEGLELCEMISSAPGHFVIYLPSAPGEAKFLGELNHEIFHLLNNQIYDWYTEGLASVFSEYATERSGNSWQEMRAFLEKGRNRDPYALSYYMMKEVSTASDNSINTILDFTVPTAAKGSMHIDIDAWLASLTQEKKDKITAIIFRYAPQLEKTKGSKNYFLPPSS